MSDGLAVLVTCRQMQNCMDVFRDRFESAGVSLTMPEVVQQPSEDELAAIIGGFDGMIAGDDPLTARVLDHATRLRIVSKWGVGIDGIDVEAARARGIAVTNTPGVFGEEVADAATGYLVLLARQLHRIDASVRAGGWLKVEGRTLAGSTLGVFGFGDVGRAVARRGVAFGMSVVVHDIAPDTPRLAADAGVDLATDVPDLFRRSDHLVLCAPLTPSTRHVVNRETLAAMPRGSHLVNVARGPLVDEAALVAALESGHIAGAALDVFEEEPLPADSPLRSFDRCVFGTHNSSNTREGVLRASELAVRNVLTGLGL